MHLRALLFFPTWSTESQRRYGSAWACTSRGCRAFQPWAYLLQSEHDRRPWKEFISPLSLPPDSNRAVSRLKCNLLYYRNNYAQVVAGVTCLYLTRNPTGTISLAIITAGAVLYIDKVACTTSKKIMALLQRARPKAAARIQASPGGADGLRCCVQPPAYYSQDFLQFHVSAHHTAVRLGTASQTTTGLL